jgi:hypothetical protein
MTYFLVGVTNNHPGNKRFRSMVDKEKRRYALSRNDEKRAIAHGLVERWTGRFLKKDDGSDSWYVASDNEACRAAQQLLVRKDPPFARGAEDNKLAAPGVPQVNQPRLPPDPAAADGAAALVELVRTPPAQGIAEIESPRTAAAEFAKTRAEEPLTDSAAAEALASLVNLRDRPSTPPRFVSEECIDATTYVH